MVFNFRNKGLGRLLFLKTITLILISLLYINAKNINRQNLIVPDASISSSNMDDSNLKAKRIYIFDELGISTVDIDQTTGGSRWILIGSFPFSGGNTYSISLSNDADGYIIADAIRIELDFLPVQNWQIY